MGYRQYRQAQLMTGAEAGLLAAAGELASYEAYQTRPAPPFNGKARVCPDCGSAITIDRFGNVWLWRCKANLMHTGQWQDEKSIAINRILRNNAQQTGKGEVLPGSATSRILKLMSDGEVRTAGEVAKRLRIEPNHVSTHLWRLAKRGKVEFRGKGRWRAITNRSLMMQLLTERGPQTTFEIAKALKLPPNCVSSDMAAMAKRGQVMRDGGFPTKWLVQPELT